MTKKDFIAKMVIGAFTVEATRGWNRLPEVYVEVAQNAGAIASRIEEANPDFFDPPVARKDFNASDIETFVCESVPPPVEDDDAYPEYCYEHV